MEGLMQPQKRLVADHELPPINFSLEKRHLDRPDKSQLKKHDPFYKQFFQAGGKDANKADLQKKLIVQAKKLHEHDTKGYTEAAVLKEENCTLAMI